MNGNRRILCAFSANIALHLPDERHIVPSDLEGRKLIAEDVTIFPSEKEGREDIRVTINGENLFFSGVAPEIEVEGSSANVAYIARALGQETTVAAAIGNDCFGHTIISTLKRDEINLMSCPRQDGTAITAAVTNNNGSTTLFCVKPHYWFEPKEVAGRLSSIAPVCVMVTSIRNRDELRLAKALFEANSQATRAFIPHRELLLKEADSPSDLFHHVLKLTDILQVNEREANLLHKGRRGESSAFTVKDLEAMTEKLSGVEPEVLIVTLGGKGAATVAFHGHGREIFHHKAYEVKVVDTTGSGDAFLVAFLHAQAQGVDHRRAVAFASWVAGLNTMGRGGHYAQVSPESLQQFLATEGQ